MVLTVGAGLALVVVAFSAAITVVNFLTRPWSRVLTVSALPATNPPALPGLAPSATASVSQVWVMAGEPLPIAQALDAAASLLPHLTGVIALGLALMVGRRLLADRPFSRLLTVGLAVLASLMVATAFGQPALSEAATAVGYEALHWPTHADAAALPPDALLVVTLPWFVKVNWVLVTVGVLLGGLAILARRGEAQQHTVEGLV